MATIGIDIASVDGNGIPDLQLAKSQGHLRYVGLRAVEGVTPDSTYDTYRKLFDSAKIPNFPYLIMTPGVSTPEAQADKLLSVVGKLNERFFPPAIDVEGSRRGLTATQWRDWVVRAFQKIFLVTGVSPLIYTSKVYWEDRDGMDNLPAPELADCLGWWKYWPFPTRSRAVYDPAVVDRLSPPWVPPPWGTQWGIQQYQGDAVGYPGFKATVDMDRINVTRRGSKGGLVSWIQRRLRGLAVDGDFGPATEAAVKSFQSSRGVASDGIVGLDTLQLLCWVRV